MTPPSGLGGESARIATSPSSDPILSRVEARPKRSSSSGIGALILFTAFEESTITTKRSALAATIFSRVCAPPPPLTSQWSGATWSAPSIARSSRSSSSKGSTGIPSAFACSSVATEVATQRRFPVRRAAIAGSRWATVEPVPRPTFIPFWTSSAAASAASFFSASRFVVAMPGNLWLWVARRTEAVEGVGSEADGSRSGSPHGDRRALHQHHPDTLYRRHSEGQLGAPGLPDGPGAPRLRDLAALPAVRPAAADLAQPRPLRPLQRPRIDAALLDALSDRRACRRPGVRGGGRPCSEPRGHQALPPARLEVPGSPRVPLDVRRGGDHRPAGAGRRDKRRHGCRVEVARRPLQRARIRDLRLRRLHRLR